MTADASAVAEILTAGGVALLPTDTIYGLHAVATNERAIARIAHIKGRDDDKPFIVLVSSIIDAEALGARFSQLSRPILHQYWPGPLTAIVPLDKPIAASRNATTIAVRVPASAWIHDVMKRTGPLASTSANRSGESPMREVNQLLRDLQNLVDITVDAGPLNGKPSTIVDFTNDEPRFIREGDSLFTQKVWKTLRKSL